MVAAASLIRSPHGPAALLLGLTGLAWFLLEVRQGLRRRPGAVRADRGSLMALRGFAFAGSAVAIFGAEVVPPAAFSPVDVASWLALVFMWCGVGLRLWCFITLGRYFTLTVQTSPDQPVITAGPYRLLRHPSYAGILLATFGVSLLFGNWVSTIGLTALVAAGVAYRIRVEERALLETLGDSYRDYAAGRRRLVPFVW